MARKKTTTETVSISMESELVAALDFCCHQRDIARSAAAREAIKLWISQQLAKRPEFWDRVYFGVNNNSSEKKVF